MKIKRILVSRVDSIGDVVLTLPMVGLLRSNLEGVEIFFMGRSYTKSVVDACSSVDRFVDYDVLCGMKFKERIEYIRSLNIDVLFNVFPRYEISLLGLFSGIRYRVGTTNRIYHWLTCNRLVFLSRRRSRLHETQLNIKLLKGIGLDIDISLEEVKNYYCMDKVKPLRDDLKLLLSEDKRNIILHPKSRGSAREWGFSNYSRLIKMLDKDRYKIFITGSADEGVMLEEFIREHTGDVVSLVGRTSLDDLISFINNCYGLVSCSTGPLHIGAALGKRVVGIYSPMRPIDPGRWGPVGVNARYLVKEVECDKCRYVDRCECIESITAEEVVRELE